jgi:hypothetical protein
MDTSKNIQYGAGCLGLVWENVAKKIVEEAIRVYNLSEEQATAIRTVFLKRGTYCIEIQD